MRNRFRIFALVAGLTTSELAMAQAIPGWDVAWGPAAVPISPWANALIGLALVIAGYAFLRKRAGAGLMTLAAVALVGGLVLHIDSVARATPVGTPYTISSASGSDTLSCGSGDSAVGAVMSSGFIIGTSVAGGVTLTVTQKNGAWLPPPGECITGTHLNPGQTCNLRCPV